MLRGLLMGAALFGGAANALTADRGAQDLQARDDHGELAAEIARGLADGKRKIVVPKARYMLKGAGGAYFRFSGLKDVEIDFSGSQLIGTSPVRMLSFENCTNVVVRRATIDYDPLPFTQAVIEKADEKGTWDVRVIDGYPAPDDCGDVWPLQVYDRHNFELKNPMRCWAGFKLEKTGPRQYRISGGDDRRGEVGDICVWSIKKMNEGFVLSDCQFTIFLGSCRECTLEDVKAYSTGPSGFFCTELNSFGNRYRGLVLDRCPVESDYVKRGVRRLRSGNHDGLNSRKAEKGPQIENCVIRYQCDDCVNISGQYLYVAGVEGRKLRLLDKSQARGWGAPLKAGDLLQVMSSSGETLDPVRVVSVTHAGKPSEAELRHMKTLGLWPGNELMFKDAFTVEVADAGRIARDDVVVPENARGNGFEIRNCTFGPNRALGMRIRGSNGAIVSNTVNRTEGMGLFLGPEYQWFEGGSFADVKVCDNVFSGCGKRSVEIGGTAANRRPLPGSAHPGLVLTGNRFVGTGNPPSVSGCDGALIDGNTFLPRPERRGVMLPMRVCTEADFQTLESWGVNLVRYQMTKAFFQKGPDQGGFEAYSKWLDGKLDHLMDFIIPECRKRGMKVVVDLHEPPGGREPTMEWSIYYNQEYLDQFLACWRKIATRVKGNEDVVYGYDLLNEPVQKRPAKTLDYLATYEKAAKLVRTIDPKTPIIVESRDWDAPEAFAELRPIGVDNVIYEVHMYRPQAFTHQGTGSSPKTVGAKWPDSAKGWNRDFIRERLSAVRDFERKYKAKIYVGEFSAIAWGEGAENYLSDCIAVFTEYGWDWTYHAFREWEPWSVEHECHGPGQASVASSDNPRRRVLLEGLRKRCAK